MTPQFSSSAETMLKRLDKWNSRDHWLPEPDQWFPGRVFWGIFAWNFPILILAIGLIFTAMYRADADPTGLGLILPVGWVWEMAAVTLLLAVIVDTAACLWIRRVWNKRTRWIRANDED